jgi:hypothetical protein
MTSKPENEGAKTQPDHAKIKTDGAMDDEFKRLKRPVNSDGFLIDRELSPEEKGRAGAPREGDKK